MRMALCVFVPKGPILRRDRIIPVDIRRGCGCLELDRINSEVNLLRYATENACDPCCTEE